MAQVQPTPQRRKYAFASKTPRPAIRHVPANHRRPEHTEYLLTALSTNEMTERIQHGLRDGVADRHEDIFLLGGLLNSGCVMSFRCREAMMGILSLGWFCN
jgi:hypothetical protein